MCCLLLLTAGQALAGAVDSGAYTLRYSVINSLQIPASVAKANGIKRAGDTAVITITLQKPTPEQPYRAVAAEVIGTARTLIGTPQPLAFNRIDASNSIYSLATVALPNDQQTVTFDLDVKTEDGSARIPLRFTQKLFRRKN